MSSLHESLDRIIGKAMAYDPEKRFSTCSEFIRVLKWYRKNHLKGLARDYDDTSDFPNQIVKESKDG